MGGSYRGAPSCKPPMAGDASRERFRYRDSRSCRIADVGLELKGGHPLRAESSTEPSGLHPESLRCARPRYHHVVANIEEAARRARTRLDHFDRRGHELATSIAAWSAENPVHLRIEIAEDRLSWEGHWEISDPPVEHWALILSDAAHQLRATLDNTLHYIAEKEGSSPKQLKDVQFPIVVEEAKWGNASRRIAMLPEPVRAAIEAIQPFQRDEAERRGDLLWVLS